MGNYCGKCGTPLPIDSDSDNCWRHGGPALTTESQVRCPFCRETILAEARKCRHCGEFLTQRTAPTLSENTKTAGPGKAGEKGDLWKNVRDWAGRHPVWALVIGLFLIGYVGSSFVQQKQDLSATSSTHSQTISAQPANAITAKTQATQKLPEFSKMTVTQHLTEAKRLISPTAQKEDLEEADLHLKEVLKRSPGNGDAIRLYDLATARAKQIAAEIEENWAVQAKAHPQKDLAQIKCEEAVSANLKAPSTASFAPYSSTEILDLGKWMYRVHSYVDAENSFGAHIRTPYSCTVQCVAVDACAVKGLTLSQ
jgi:hypothetical protein